MTAKERNRNRIYITLVSLIILIPAITILAITVKKAGEQKSVEDYLETKVTANETIVADWTLLDNNEDRIRDSLKLVLKIIGNPLSELEIKKTDSELEAILGKNLEVITYQSEEIPIEDIRKLENQLSGIQGEMQQKLLTLEERQIQRTKEIERLNTQIDSLENSGLESLYQEVKLLFPELSELAIALEGTSTDFTTIKNVPITLLKWNPKLSSSQIRTREKKLKEFIKMRLDMEELIMARN